MSFGPDLTTTNEADRGDGDRTRPTSAPSDAPTVTIGDGASGQIAVGHGNLQIGRADGAVFNLGGAPSLKDRARPIAVRPRRPPELFGRDEIVMSVTASVRTDQPVLLTGRAGIGKTAVLRRLAHGDCDGPDGLAYVSARGLALEDVFQCLFDLFIESDPPLKPSDARLRTALADKHATLLVDDLDLEGHAPAPLIDVAPGCAFVLASREPAVLREASVIALGELDEAAAVQLVAATRGRPVDDDLRAATRALIAEVGASPRALEAAAAGASADDRSRAPAPLARIGDDLTAQQRGVVATLAAVHAALPEPLIEAVTGAADTAAAMHALEGAGLARQDHDGWVLAERAVDDATIDVDAEDEAERRRRRLLAALLDSYATTDDAEVHEANLPVALELLRHAAAAGREDDVIQLGRVLEPAIVLSRRWSSWPDVLDAVRSAALNLGDEDAHAWVLHETGTRLLALGQPAASLAAFVEALEIRRRLHDRGGTEVTTHNIGVARQLLPAPPRLPPPRSRWARATRFARSHWILSLLLGLVAIVATVAMLAVAAVSYSRSGDQPAARPTPTQVTSARLSSDPTTVDFGPVLVGTTEPSRVRVTNAGPGPAEVVVPPVSSASFSIGPNDCGGTLAPEVTCAVTIMFSPQGEGNHESVLHIELRDGDDLTVPLLGVGSPKPTTTVTTDPPTSPPPSPLLPPTNLAATNPTEGTIRITWSAPATNAVTGYVVQRCFVSKVGVCALEPRPETPQTSIVENVSPGVTARYEVAALYSSRSSPFSEPVDVTSRDFPPLTPTDLKEDGQSAVSSHQIEVGVAWTRRTPDGPSETYLIEYCVANAQQACKETTTLDAKSSLAASLRLQDHTGYQIRVVAIDAAGQRSPPSAPLPVTTKVSEIPG